MARLYNNMMYDSYLANRCLEIEAFQSSAVEIGLYFSSVCKEHIDCDERPYVVRFPSRFVHQSTSTWQNDNQGRERVGGQATYFLSVVIIIF